MDAAEAHRVVRAGQPGNDVLCHEREALGHLRRRRGDHLVVGRLWVVGEVRNEFPRKARALDPPPAAEVEEEAEAAAPLARPAAPASPPSGGSNCTSTFKFSRGGSSNTAWWNLSPSAAPRSWGTDGARAVMLKGACVCTQKRRGVLYRLLRTTMWR